MPRLHHAVALLSLAVSATALGQDLNVISAVEVKDAGASVVLTVTGTKPPNFTTFSMADPPRFVLDLSESRFEGVPEEMPFNDAVILVVKNLSYGSNVTSIARIMVAFAVDVDPPDVQAQGTSLVVRIAKPAGLSAVAKANPAAEREREEAEARAQAEAERRSREEAEARAQAEAERRAQQEAEARAQAEAERGAREAAERERLVGEREALARAELERLAREETALADRPERSASEALPVAAQPARDDRERQQEEASAAAAAEAERKGQEEAARSAEERRQREEAIAVARAEAERKRQEEEERRTEAKRQREEAIAAARAEAERTKQEEEERRTEARRERDEARLSRARDAALVADAPSAQLREIGFRQMEGVSRVFVRTSAPARFTIQDVGENLIRVELENTRVTRRNDARFLDTSFFPSAVALVTPSRRGSSYVVDIKLKERVPYQQKIEGDMLAIDFERPATAGAQDAGAPADALPGDAAPGQ